MGTNGIQSILSVILDISSICRLMTAYVLFLNGILVFHVCNTWQIVRCPYNLSGAESVRQWLKQVL